MIEFDSVLPEDAGEYMCMAENRLGVDYWPVVVSVRRRFPVDWLISCCRQADSEDLRYSANSLKACGVNLFCEVKANPPSAVREIICSVGTSDGLFLSSERHKLHLINADLVQL